MIRPALAHEAEAMRALVRAAYAPWVPVIGREPFPMTDDYPARVAAGQAWLLETDQGLEGALVLEDEPDALLLDNIAVAPGSQGRGHGLTLMAFAEAEARRRGYTTIRLYTNELMTTNIALYARHGYVETHRAEGAGFRRVFMEKHLA